MKKFIYGIMRMPSGYMNIYKGYPYKINTDYIITLHSFESCEEGELHIAQVLMGKELVEFVISKEDYENLWNMSIK